MKLELGSGDRPAGGFVHLDARELPHVELHGRAEAIHRAERCGGYQGDLPTVGCCEEIRATHLLEHFSHRQTPVLLEHWREFLAAGGRLHLEVPNLAGHVAAWTDGRSSDERFVTYLFGEQDYPGNFHQTMFTAATLHGALQKARFEQIRIRDVGLVLVADARRPPVT